MPSDPMRPRTWHAPNGSPHPAANIVGQGEDLMHDSVKMTGNNFLRVSSYRDTAVDVRSGS